MSKLSSLLWGAAVGAGMMYFLDPQQGNRRKAMIRDRAYHLRNMGDEAFSVAVNDLRNRVRGVLAEGMALVSNEALPDEVVQQRVRARLGMLTRHPGAIQVSVQDGQVMLDGDILEDEAGMVTRSLKHIRGVMGVENRLRSHVTAGNIPQLQGEGWLPQAGQWSPSTRLLATAGAGYLLLYSMMRGGFIGFIARMSGLGLGVRALSNRNPRELIGSGEDHGMLRVRKTIHINAPVEEVYGLWSNFENFSRFMQNVETIHMMGERSHWVVKGPAGSKVEFDAVTTAMVPNELVSWETAPGSTVRHSGQVRFRETGTGTQVNVTMLYTPPAGVVGHAVASLFGKDPKSEMDADLVRMKSLLERGRTTAGGRKVTREEITGGMQGERKRSGSVPVTGANSTGEFERMDYGGAEIGGGEIPSEGAASGAASESGAKGPRSRNLDVSDKIRRDMGGGEENSPREPGQL
jgi:uncharacterized membrane protein